MQIIARYNHFFPLIGFLFLLFSYHLIFFRFFPTEQGMLGQDYAYFLPNLLNGKYWFNNNGLFAVPWFTPAFCGGVPFFPNPQNIYYSLPQLLSLFVNPLHGVYISVLIFAALGLIGTFLLLRNVFAVSTASAFLGSTIFLFNGFYSSRMLIGHITYQVFALVPLLSWLLLNKTKSKVLETGYVLLAGVILAYMVYAGAANFIVPVILCIVCIWSLTGIVQQASFTFCKRLCLSGIIAILISLAKLYPSLLYLQGFTRDYYPLPGFDGVWNAAKNIFMMLFLTPFKDISDNLVNYPFDLNQNEFNFSITIVPLVLILIILFKAIKYLTKIRNNITGILQSLKDHFYLDKQQSARYLGNYQQM